MIHFDSVLTIRLFPFSETNILLFFIIEGKYVLLLQPMGHGPYHDS